MHYWFFWLWWYNLFRIWLLGGGRVKKTNSLKFKIIITIILLCYTVVLFFGNLACPIKNITGVNCLGCGLTRAFVSILRLDFTSAFSYHFMFWSVPLLYICFLLDGKLFKNKILNLTFYLIILLGFILNWILHI